MNEDAQTIIPSDMLIANINTISHGANDSNSMGMTGLDVWWTNAVIYEVYIDKFSGNLKGLTEKLDYLKKLGIDCIHLLPHYPSPMVDDGYDVSDYRNVRPEFGTVEDFDAFTATAHERGMRVMTDFVLNHTSNQHPWFKEASSSEDNPKRNYYIWSKMGTEYLLARNVFSHAKPSNWVYNPATKDYYFSTFYPDQADLNYANPDVVKEITDAMDFWVSHGVDGFRLDAVCYIAKKEGTTCKSIPETHELLRQIRWQLEAKHPNVALLGEVHDTMEATMEYFGKGDECHMMYHFLQVEFLFLSLITGDKEPLRKLIEETSQIPPNCQWATFLRHHDEMELTMLRPEDQEIVMGYFDPEKEYRFHSGLAMRLATLFKGDKEKILDIYNKFLSLPGNPIIYYGDELGMLNESSRTGEIDARRFVRGHFNWLEAEKQINDPESLFNQLAARVKARKAEIGKN